MTTIGASTTHSLKVKKPIPTLTKKGGVKKSAKAGAGRRGSIAPPLTPATLNTPQAVQAFQSLTSDAQKDKVIDLFRACTGESSLIDKSKPHTASTTRDRSGAAADLAVATATLGIAFALRSCGIQDDMQRILFPQGMTSLFQQTDGKKTPTTTSLKPSLSSLSLASMDDAMSVATINSTGTDSKRGKSTPPDAREGCLLLIRALCEKVGKPAEPFVVGGFLAAALDECGSSSSSVRQAAEDAATALVSLAHPWAFPRLVCPLLLQSLHSTEWRVKFNGLERLTQCAKTTAPKQTCQLLPTLIPVVSSQVWDTKAQVTKAARECLLAMCQTNENPDITPAIPAVVNAICKPADTNKAVQELMATTFVASVDASTLSILCPVLARALKEKLAINKRAACIVISNMSRLVDSPQAVAPFGPLLVPELKKVASNVQFDEIRDAALSALGNLTKALGHLYSEDDSAGKAESMAQENAAVEAEQQRIEEERMAEIQRDEAIRKKEEEEKKKFKVAMNAQRELEKMQAVEAAAKRKEEEKLREKQKLSTKGASGKCQACGLKKCKTTCMFKSG